MYQACICHNSICFHATPNYGDILPVHAVTRHRASWPATWTFALRLLPVKRSMFNSGTAFSPACGSSQLKRTQSAVFDFFALADTSSARPGWLRYFVALATVIVAAALRAALTPAFGPTALRFLTFFPGVALAAWYGGLGPGLVAVALSAVAALYFFLEPTGSVLVYSSHDVVALLSFLIASLIIVGAIESMHRAKRQLARARDLLVTTLSSIGDGVIVSDAQGRVRFLNPEAERLAGWRHAEAAGRPLAEVFHIVNEDSRQPVENPVEKVLRLGKVVGLANHTVLLARHGGETPIDDSAAPIRQADGAMFGVVLVFRDVGEQRAAEYARVRLAAIVENSGDAILTKTLDGVAQTWNAAAERLFGYRPDEIVGKPVALIVPPDLLHEETQILERIRSGQPYDRVETTRVAKDGRRIPVQISVSPLRDRDGRIVGASKIIHDVTDVVAAREALTQEKELLATTLASIGDAVIVTDTQGRVTYLNREAERLTGWNLAEAQGAPLPTVFRIVNEQTRQPVENPVDKVLRLGSVVGLANHTLLISKDGGETPIDDSAAPIRHAGGPLFGVVLVFRDFTARRMAEEKLRQAGDEFRSVVNHVVDGIISIDEAGIVQSFNPAAERIFGYARSEVVGRNVSMLMPAPYREEHDGYLANYRNTGKAKIIGIGREVQGRRKDGSTFPMDLGVSEYRLDARRHFTGIVRDITERKNAEQALRESELRFRMMADAAPVLIWESGTDKLCTWFNKQWLQFVGRTMEQERGNGWAENVHRDDFDRCLETYVSAFDARKPFTMTYRLRRFDGEYRWLLDSGIPRYGANREFIGYIGSCVDITERLRAEEQLREADRRKDEFLAILSHELRNPLAPIRLAVAMLRKIGPPEPELQELRNIIDRQTTQLTRLLDDLLDVSRIASGKIVLRKERANLALAVSSAVEAARPLIDARRHELIVDAPADPIFIHGDATRLAQVFANLLNNAAKFTRDGGRISLTVARDGGDAVVRVRDSGIGIHPQHADRIFEMFAQGDQSLERGQGGLGVGLALAKTLIELHGGTVEARSAGPGAGSEFIVRLPALSSPPPPTAEQPRESPASASAPQTGRRILIADDNVDSARVLAAALRHAGHSVITAHDGLASVEAATSFDPDVAILDIGMPRMNGYDVARELRKRFGPRITLIAVTGWGQEEDKARAADAGFRLHFTKPIDLAVIEGALAGLGAPPHSVKSGDDT